MADQNISQILAALASQRPQSNPSAPQLPPQQPPPHMGQPYQGAYPTPPPPVASSNYALPQPTSSGSVDLSNVKPSNSGSVSLAEAVARARGIAAERGTPYDPNRGPGSRDTRRGMRRSRSRSRSPPRMGRDSFRDNYNPYREERRGSGLTRDRSFSPVTGGRPPGPDRFGGAGGAGGAAGSVGGSDAGTETITIESHLVGLIIGRSGENLRRVESETGARVQFLTGPEATGPHRPCKISGPHAARDHAKAEIARIIHENGKTSQTMHLAPPGGYGGGIPGGGPAGGFAATPMGGFTGGYGSGRPSGGNTPLRGAPGGANEEATQMMVPNRTVGLIIGRGGETIRDLQDRSGCHVNIVSEDKAVQGLRPVNLVGTPQQAAIAKELILEIVESDSKAQAQAQSMSGGRPMMTSTGRSDAVGERINDSISVPSEAVGMIIGKGGETIKEMQNVTGCKINVSQPSGQDVEREIGLIGTHDAIDGAKRAIMEKVRAVEEKNRGGGRAQHSQFDQYGSGTQVYGQGQGQSQGGYNQSYTQYPQQSAQQTPPQQQAQSNDPYAAYGGYENYMALWYSHMSQQPGGGQPPT